MERNPSYLLPAACLLVFLALPAAAEMALTTEKMTGTGLPAGQVLPETPAQPAAQAPFTPKALTTQKMEAWGPAPAQAPAAETAKPAAKQSERAGTIDRKELETIRKPVRKVP